MKKMTKQELKLVIRNTKGGEGWKFYLRGLLDGLGGLHGLGGLQGRLLDLGEVQRRRSSRKL